MLRRTPLIATAALALFLTATATAQAGALYYPKRAYFEMRVTGTQTTTVHADATCYDEATNSEVQRSGELTETVRFSTRRPGIVLFKSDGHGGLDLFQESDDFEDGVRPVLARGTVERQSTLSRNGGTVAGCDGAPAAEGCGSEPFDSWRLFLFGRGRKVAVGLGAGGAAGPDPFPRCDHSALFPEILRDRAERVPPRAPFRKRRMTLSVTQPKVTHFDNAYENSTGTVSRTIDWKATLVRKGPVTRGGQPIR